MQPEQLPTMEDERRECPSCKRESYQYLIEKAPAVMHIPARVVLLCPFCRIPWYIPDPEAEEDVTHPNREKNSTET